MKKLIVLFACSTLSLACSSSPKSTANATNTDVSAPLQSDEKLDDSAETHAQDKGFEDGSDSPISAVISSKKENYQACYYNEQALKPQLAGSIHLQWDISPSGAVNDVEVLDDSVRDEAVQTCLVKEVETLQFPEREKTLRIRYPFSFAPRGVSYGEIREMMYKNKAEIDACREKHSDNSGSLVLGWSIDANGSVLNERVLQSQINNPELENCLLRVIKPMQFNPTMERVEVEYPFEF
ncbi:MAG: AgmX/PglI C-terminal domain-containing protein [Bradymonadales bacterium]|jgi:TonB family protein